MNFKIVSLLALTLCLCSRAFAAGQKSDFDIKVATRAGGDEELASIRRLNGTCSVRSGLETWKKADAKACERALALSGAASKAATVPMMPHAPQMEVAFKLGTESWKKLAPLALVKSCDRNDVCTESGGTPTKAVKELVDFISETALKK